MQEVGSKIGKKLLTYFMDGPKGTLQKNLVSVLLADCRYLILETTAQTRI